MRLSNITIVLLILVLLVSVFVADLTNLINVDINYYKNENKASNFTINRQLLKMTNNSDHLFWFLQISDLHVSIFHDLTRISDLNNFCKYTVPVFNPPVVLVSGDLTDAKERNNVGSQQYEDEWILYYKALTECKNHNNNTIWLDIRGNHDNFDVKGIYSKNNYYTKYSEQGRKHARSYKFDLDYAGDKYSFIAIDACIDPGPRRPFNFIGILKEDEIMRVIELTEYARTHGTNYTIWFGHYPTSCILAQMSGGIRAVFGRYSEGYAYLCGHLHQLGGIVPHMYTIQQDGFLELELGDWKDNRVYRLLAMDHGLLSFVDIKHNDWPVILITNPKNVLFLIPARENATTILESTHIRVLVFSPIKIIKVSARVNNEKWKSCYNVKGPLYVTEWNPESYKSSVHMIEVLVEDEDGQKKIISQPFSLDGSRLSFGILPRIALMTNISKICMFGIFLIICTVPLCILRYLNYRFHAGKIRLPRFKIGYQFVRKLWTLSTVDRLFYPLMLYALYISVGPWSIGYLVEDNLGIIFAWGIFIDGAFLPGSFTYAYGFLQLLTFHLPMICLLAHVCDIRLQIHAGKIRHRSILRILGNHIPFFIILLIQIIMAYVFWLEYGTIALIVGPLRSWSIIFAIWIWLQAVRLPEKCTRDSYKVWCSNGINAASYRSRPSS